MGKLNFCKPCGSLQLEEAKDQLEKLLEKKLLPTRCGLCDVLISSVRTRSSKRKLPVIHINVEPKIAKKDVKEGEEKSSDSSEINNGMLLSAAADSNSDHTPGDYELETIEVPVRDIRDDNSDTTGVNSVSDEDIIADDFEPEDDDDDDNDDDFIPQDEEENINETESAKKVKAKEGYVDKSLLGADILALMSDTDEKENVVKLQCNQCSDSFLSVQSMLTHIKCTHKVKVNKNPYQCQTCELRFRGIKILRAHINKKHKQVQRCTMCNKTSLRKNFLQVHMKTHERKDARKKLSCPELNCTVQFERVGDLNRHMMIHTGEKPYICETCGKCFNRTSDLTAHIRLHTGDYLYCTLCDNYRTNRQSTLNAHVRERHLIQPKVKKPPEAHICEICGGIYPSKRNLRLHTTGVHTKEKLYFCTQCDYVTSHQSSMPQHVKTVHEKLKPYKCQHCDKSFALPRTRQMHERTHTGETPYECEICGKRFKRKDGYRYHKRLHLADYPHECDVCGFKAVKKQIILRHKEIHHTADGMTTCSFKCTKCDMSFPSTLSLRQHNRGHKAGAEYIPKREQQCKDCDFSSDRPEHLRRHEKRFHSAEGSYECGYCHKKFANASSCKDHVERQHMKYFKPLQAEEIIAKVESIADVSVAVLSDGNNFTSGVTASSTGPAHTIKTENTPSHEEIVAAAVLRIPPSTTDVNSYGGTAAEPGDDDEGGGENESTSPKKEKEKEGYVDKSIVGADILALMCDTHEQNHFVKVQCKACHDSFTSIFTMIKHVRSMHKIEVSEDPYQCSTCEMRFRRVKVLRAHMDKEHKQVQRCPICNKTSLRKNFLQVHMKTHEKKETSKLKCPELNCTVQCSTKKDLKRHLMIHSGEKPYTCDTCGKAFIRKPDLKAHMRIHTGDYLYCTLCDDYRTTRQSLLNKHMKDRHSNKPQAKSPKETHGCEICGGTFSSKRNLTKHHLRKHTNEKLNSCRHCDFTTRDSSYLQQHVKIVHGKEKPYKCRYCKKAFALSKTRKKHEKIHTRDGNSMDKDTSSNQKMTSTSTSTPPVSVSSAIPSNITDDVVFVHPAREEEVAIAAAVLGMLPGAGYPQELGQVEVVTTSTTE